MLAFIYILIGAVSIVLFYIAFLFGNCYRSKRILQPQKGVELKECDRSLLEFETDNVKILGAVLVILCSVDSVFIWLAQTMH